MSTPDMPSSKNTRPSGGRLGPRLAIVGVAASAAYLYFRYSEKPLHNGAVTGIEKAYSAGGATPTHTPAYGGTPRGNPDDHKIRDGGAGKQKFEVEGMEQRPGDRNVAKKQWDKMKYGSEEGK